MLKALFSLAIIALALPFLAANPAAAQATRTWVSGVGNDADVCSRTAPCKTFAAAYLQTLAGGEINCLDSGGFGTLSITKSIAIICEGVVAGILATSGNGITINGASTDVVTLKGLDIDGQGTGTAGIFIQTATKVTILNSSIRNFRGSSSAVGVLVSGAVTLTVNIQDSTILDNQNGIGVFGVLLSYKIVNVKNTMITGNSADGIALQNANDYVNVFESVISNNGGNGVNVVAGASTANVRRSQINNNVVAGLKITGSMSLINVSQSDLLNNTSAFSIGAGTTIASDGQNNVVGAVGTNPNGTITLK